MWYVRLIPVKIISALLLLFFFNVYFKLCNFKHSRFGKIDDNQSIIVNVHKCFKQIQTYSVVLQCFHDTVRMLTEVTPCKMFVPEWLFLNIWSRGTTGIPVKFHILWIIIHKHGQMKGHQKKRRKKSPPTYFPAPVLHIHPS